MRVDKGVIVDLLTEIIKIGPWHLPNPDWGNFECFFCGEEEPDHREDCPWEKGAKVLAEEMSVISEDSA
jgi:hypothetical protein